MNGYTLFVSENMASCYKVVLNDDDVFMPFLLRLIAIEYGHVVGNDATTIRLNFRDVQCG